MVSQLAAYGEPWSHGRGSTRAQPQHCGVGDHGGECNTYSTGCFGRRRGPWYCPTFTAQASWRILIPVSINISISLKLCAVVSCPVISVGCVLCFFSYVLSVLRLVLFSVLSFGLVIVNVKLPLCTPLRRVMEGRYSSTHS